MSVTRRFLKFYRVRDNELCRLFVTCSLIIDLLRILPSSRAQLFFKMLQCLLILNLTAVVNSDVFRVLSCVCDSELCLLLLTCLLIVKRFTSSLHRPTARIVKLCNYAYT